MEKCTVLFPSWLNGQDLIKLLKKSCNIGRANTVSPKFGLNRFINGFSRFGYHPFHPQISQTTDAFLRHLGCSLRNCGGRNANLFACHKIDGNRTWKSNAGSDIWHSIIPIRFSFFLAQVYLPN